MNKWFEILFGLILLIGITLVVFYSVDWTFLGLSWNFKSAAWEFLKGGIVWFVVMVGLLFLMLGISDLKN